MAYNDAQKKRLWLPKIANPTPPRDTVGAPKKIACGYSENSTFEDPVPIEIKGTTPSPHFLNHVVGNLHPTLMQVAISLPLYLGLGSVCFYLLRDQMKGNKTNGIVDSVYFCTVTMTTVGYGDITPDTALTKLLVCAYVFIGMALVGLVLSKAADYMIEKQETFLVKAIRRHRKVGPAQTRQLEVETNGVGYKCLWVFILLLVLGAAGVIFLVTVEKLNLIDAIYCVCITVSTLGYGDVTFRTKGGRVFAVFWILTSTILLAQFILYVGELKTRSRQRALLNRVLARSNITDGDLEAADLDHDGVVDAAEFVLYKLKVMGKISQQDISIIMKEFEGLDVNKSGSLPVNLQLIPKT
ncbi:Two-pore potassium channel 1 [Morella rubra]|uniref:Two-pore potassium channel 1 n=1 Tax=Morella rubra TaxID=262757 RepID=A0A6A1VQP8_9ROSI|nr:Two-pore potassium channel 1 [Morella rubra]